MKRPPMRCILSAMTVLALAWLPALALADSNWWESKQAGSATDQIVIADTTVQGKAQSASRTNWEAGYIEVMAGATADMRDTVNLGHAYAVALKTARHLAYEKMAETVSGINLYSDATYDRELMVDSNLRTMLRAMVRNAQVVKEEKSQFNDGSIWVEVTLGLKMFGQDGLAAPTLDWAQRNPVRLQPVPVPEPVLTAPAAAPALPIAYSGLVIDAGGLGASPAMLPRVLTVSGEVLYGTGTIDKGFIIQMGLMGYQDSLEKALTQKRVGSNPLVVKATQLAGRGQTDFVISDSDAKQVRAADAATGFLKECRVIAVIN